MNPQIVWQWMEEAGQTFDFNTAKLYSRLVDEEYEEWCLATTDEEDLDAVLDLIWVLIGYAKCRGYNLEDGWQEVVKSNFSKFPFEKDSNGKIKKSINYKPPNLTNCV